MRSGYWFERLIDRLSSKWEHLAITRLPFYIIFLNAFMYVLMQIKPSFVELLTLNFGKIYQGQVWRLVTYLFIPPDMNIIFVAFALLFVYFIGASLEAEWGAFRFNCFYLLGMLGTTVAGFCFPSAQIDNTMLNLSLFFAFATIYPDYTVYLFLIIPVKVKYLAALSWIGVALNMAAGSMSSRVTTVAMLINYFLFFWPYIIQNIKVMRRGTRPLPVFSPAKSDYFHKCDVCGKTENDDASLEFRVCAKCAGAKEYCIAHLKGHVCK